MPTGVDYSFSRPSPAALRAAGYTFAVRYLTGSGKALTTSELDGLHAAGLTVAFISESSGQETLGGAAAGAQAGAVANAAMDALGVPHDRPIYYTVDYDDRGHPGCLPLIASFLEAAQHGRREARAYGSVRVIDYLRQPGYQTAAWSGNAVSAHAAIYQHQFMVNFQGSMVDVNDARVSDFGQYPAPIPEEIVTPQDKQDIVALVVRALTPVIKDQCDASIAGKFSTVDAHDKETPNGLIFQMRSFFSKNH